MKLFNLGLALSFLTASAVMAQGPLTDKIIVTLPYAVNVNGTVLQPGDYVIRQHDSAGGGSRVLLFYSDKGMKFETTAMSIPALDNKTPEETSLKLNQYGSDYYLNKIWVQGKNYGYEFPIPDSIRSREKEMRASSVSGRYETSSSDETKSTTTTTTAVATQPAQVEQPAPAPEPVAAAPEPAPVAAAEPVVERSEPTVIAQNTPPPSPPAVASSTDTMTDTSAPSMPSTAMNWFDFVAVGSAFAGSGLLLRRKA